MKKLLPVILALTFSFSSFAKVDLGTTAGINANNAEQRAELRKKIEQNKAENKERKAEIKQNREENKAIRAKIKELRGGNQGGVGREERDEMDEERKDAQANSPKLKEIDPRSK